MGTSMLDIQLRRIYEAPSAEDGIRVLVDRRWPAASARHVLHSTSGAPPLPPRSLYVVGTSTTQRDSTSSALATGTSSTPRLPWEAQPEPRCGTCMT